MELPSRRSVLVATGVVVAAVVVGAPARAATPTPLRRDALLPHLGSTLHLTSGSMTVALRLQRIDDLPGTHPDDAAGCFSAVFDAVGPDPDPAVTASIGSLRAAGSVLAPAVLLSPVLAGRTAGDHQYELCVNNPDHV